MNEFDDRDVRDALRRRAGAPTDGYGLEAARSAVVAQAGRVRRRRAAVAGSAAMAAVIATAVLLIGPGTDSVVTTPADRTDQSLPSSVDTTTPTNPDRTSADRTGPDQTTTAPPSSTAPSPATTIPAVGPPTVIAPTTTATAPPETTVSAPPTTAEPAPPTSVTAPSTTTTPSGPAPFTETYTSGGGSIVVRWDGTALILQSVTEAAGFESEVEDDLADRIRVRFRGDDGDFRIEIRYEDGAIVRVE